MRVLCALCLLLCERGAQGCTVDGLWHYHDEEYMLKMDNSGALSGPLTATVVPGHVAGCTWCVAKGNLSTDGTVTMHYDNGDSNSGTLSKDCKSLSWGWEAGPTSAPAEVDVAPCVPGKHGGGGNAPTTHPEIEVVHVINSCHLDIGFADSSQGIINRYFDHHFPLAAQEGKAFRSGTLSGPHPKNLNFMFQ